MWVGSSVQQLWPTCASLLGLTSYVTCRQCRDCSQCVVAQGVGGLRASLVVDGILVRDLQMKPDSPHSHFLRPLPARACLLATYVAKFRRRLLRLTSYSLAHKL